VKLEQNNKNNSRLEGCICKQLTYFIKLGIYPNRPDMNELCDILHKIRREIENV